jgi:hypothetical protein
MNALLKIYLLNTLKKLDLLVCDFFFLGMFLKFIFLKHFLWLFWKDSQYKDCVVVPLLTIKEMLCQIFQNSIKNKFY